MPQIELTDMDMSNLRLLLENEADDFPPDEWEKADAKNKLHAKLGGSGDIYDPKDYETGEEDDGA